MHLELRHLRTVHAIHAQGGLARAAEVLNITQSALCVNAACHPAL